MSSPPRPFLISPILFPAFLLLNLGSVSHFPRFAAGRGRQGQGIGDGRIVLVPGPQRQLWRGGREVKGGWSSDDLGPFPTPKAIKPGRIEYAHPEPSLCCRQPRKRDWVEGPGA